MIKLVGVVAILLGFVLSAAAQSASFSDLSKIAQQADFQARVMYALTTAAIAAYNEAPATAGHAARAAYAIRVLNGNVGASSVAELVLTNSTIAAEASAVAVGNNIPDADIQFAVNSVYSALAGA